MSTPEYFFSSGDYVMVRTWDSMLEEYGPDPYGDIAVHPDKLSFVLGMSPFCGKVFVVARVEYLRHFGNQPIYRLDIPRGLPRSDYSDSPYPWAFTSAMLLPITRPNEFKNYIPAPFISFDALLQGAN